MDGIHVALSAEKLGDFFGLPITNTLVTSWVVVLLLIAVGFIMGSRLQMVPGRFQTLLEWLFGGIYDYVTEVLESRNMARRFFPLLITIFLFIFVANWLEFVPGVGSIGFFNDEHEFVSLFRSVNTDLNVPLAFAVGLVELIGEIVRVVSLSFRLFGNILAGEIIILVAAYFMPYFLPVPLMVFELFIGFLQAAIFALLTLFFLKLAVA